MQISTVRPTFSRLNTAPRRLPGQLRKPVQFGFCPICAAVLACGIGGGGAVFAYLRSGEKTKGNSHTLQSLFGDNLSPQLITALEAAQKANPQFLTTIVEEFTKTKASPTLMKAIPEGLQAELLAALEAKKNK